MVPLNPGLRFGSAKALEATIEGGTVKTTLPAPQIAFKSSVSVKLSI